MTPNGPLYTIMRTNESKPKKCAFCKWIPVTTIVVVLHGNLKQMALRPLKFVQ